MTAPPAPTPAPAPTAGFTVSSSITTGNTLSGSVVWIASPSLAASSISKVAFFIDGALEWTEHTPSVYNGDSGQLNTRTLANGPHVLMVKATASNGSTASASAAVTVSNTAPPLLRRQVR